MSPPERGRGSDGSRSDGSHWFEDVARHLGPAYLRYSFTKGTEQEVDQLVKLLDLQPGERILDVGCGPGRHALALAALGFEVMGVDISTEFIDLARAAAANENLDNVTFAVADARSFDVEALFGGGPVDVAISLCQGAFGLSGGPGAPDVLPARELDEAILDGMSQALRPAGRLAVSAFSAYFMMQFLEDQDTFDAQAGVNHEQTVLRDEEGVEVDADLWTTCFTPRELRLLARAVGLEPTRILGVTPGKYGTDDPSLGVPEFLLLATKPSA